MPPSLLGGNSLKPERPSPREVAIIGAGAIGPDIGYYLKSALPEVRLFLVDIVEAPLKSAEKRLAGYIQNLAIRCGQARQLLRWA